jgi:hypothetical protein
MNRIRHLALAALWIVLGCHAQPVGAPGSVENVITREQIDAVKASSIYDVIVRLRAEFLNDRGRTSIRTNATSRAVVFLNDQEYGIPETMRNIPPGRIETVRHFSGSEAVVRFGAQYGGGVIQLTSRTD